jgi:hypothetical protein
MLEFQTTASSARMYRLRRPEENTKHTKLNGTYERAGIFRMFRYFLSVSYSLFDEDEIFRIFGTSRVSHTRRILSHLTPTLSDQRETFSPISNPKIANIS